MNNRTGLNKIADDDNLASVVMPLSSPTLVASTQTLSTSTQTPTEEAPRLGVNVSNPVRQSALNQVADLLCDALDIADEWEDTRPIDTEGVAAPSTAFHQ